MGVTSIIDLITSYFSLRLQKVHISGSSLARDTECEIVLSSGLIKCKNNSELSAFYNEVQTELKDGKMPRIYRHSFGGNVKKAT